MEGGGGGAASCGGSEDGRGAPALERSDPKSDGGRTEDELEDELDPSVGDIGKFEGSLG